MRTVTLLFWAFAALTHALPTEHSHAHHALSARTKPKPAENPAIFHITHFQQHVSPTLNSVFFNVSDPRHSHATSCEIPGSADSVYKTDYTECYAGAGKNKLGVKFGFKVSKKEVQLRVQWCEGDKDFVSYASQLTNWDSATNISLTFDQGETYTRLEDWWFPAKCVDPVPKKGSV